MSLANKWMRKEIPSFCILALMEMNFYIREGILQGWFQGWIVDTKLQAFANCVSLSCPWWHSPQSGYFVYCWHESDSKVDKPKTEIQNRKLKN